MILRVLASAVAAAVAGGFTLAVLLCADVVGKLYLSGHGIEPSWYDDVAAAIVFGGALAAGVVAFVLAWRGRAVARRRRK